MEKIKKKFSTRLKARIQKTLLNMLKLGFLTWLIGVFLIYKKIVPCNNATEFGIFTGLLIAGIGIQKVIADKNKI